MIRIKDAEVWQKIGVLRTRYPMVTNNFPDGKFSRPRLGIFAFRLRSNKNIPAPSQKARNPAQAGCSCLFVSPLYFDWNTLESTVLRWNQAFELAGMARLMDKIPL